MELLTLSIKSLFKEMGDQRRLGDEDPIVIAKFFNQDKSAFWYALEYDEIEHACYGFVIGPPDVAKGGEWGYFSLDAMERSGNVYLDTHFKKCPISRILNSLPYGR